MVFCPHAQIREKEVYCVLYDRECDMIERRCDHVDGSEEGKGG